MIIAIEGAVLCLLFTLMVYLMSREPIRGFFIGESLALAVCATAGLVVQYVL